jgi:uncharacterized protein (DUF1810 family)
VALVLFVKDKPRNEEMSEEDSSLERFVKAQEDDFSCAILEIKAGRKRSHWMWYIFPQLEGLGISATAQFYGIKGMDEARAYLRHSVLGSRLVECMKTVLCVEGRTAEEIFGFPDVLKLRSCATLFARASQPGSVFERVLQKYYEGQPDEATLRLLDGETP